MKRSIGIACILILAACPQAIARDPTPEERAQITHKLLNSGYLEWRRIDLRTDWAVEGVYRSNGEICDLMVRTQTYEIIDEDCD